MEQQNEIVIRKPSKLNKGLMIALIICTALLITTTILWLTNQNKNNRVNATIENMKALIECTK